MLPHRINDECEEDESGKHYVELLEAREDQVESLRATKRPLAFVAPLVHLSVILPWLESRTQWPRYREYAPR